MHSHACHSAYFTTSRPLEFPSRLSSLPALPLSFYNLPDQQKSKPSWLQHHTSNSISIESLHHPSIMLSFSPFFPSFLTIHTLTISQSHILRKEKKCKTHVTFSLVALICTIVYKFTRPHTIFQDTVLDMVMSFLSLVPEDSVKTGRHADPK